LNMLQHATNKNLENAQAKAFALKIKQQ